MTTEAYDKLSRVSFHDGHPLAVAWNGWTLLLDYENWQQDTLRLRFTGVAFVSGYGGGGSLCDAVVSCDSAEIERAKELLGNDWATSDTWQGKELTQLVLTDDVPLLTVIFVDVDIEHLTEPSERIHAKFPEFE